MDERIALHSGEEVNNTYVIKREMGRGGSCIVYEAFYIDSEQLEHEVRLKEFYPYSLGLSRDGSFLVHGKNEEKFEIEKEQFVEAYRKNVAIQSEEDLINSSADAREIVEDNGTVYIVYSCDGGVTYERYQPETLKECIQITLAVAKVIQKYHNKGYLHLDIKPENILVLHETKEMIILFDFDTVCKWAELNEEKMTRISYSIGYSAPEHIRGRVSKIGIQSDIYSLGALLFDKVFDRTPEYKDRMLGAEYCWKNCGYLCDVNPRVHIELQKFFNRTLSASVKNRYQSVEEVLKVLYKLIELADVKNFWIQSNSINSKRVFVGRDKELNDIHNQLQTTNMICICGMGGIGKSELVKNYIMQYKTEYTSVSYCVYRDSLVELINGNEIYICNFERYAGEDEISYCNRKMKRLTQLCDEHTLIVIDNLNKKDFDYENQKCWEWLCGINCKIIIVSRLMDWGFAFYEVNAIRDKSLLVKLFEHYSGTKAKEKEYVKELIDYVGGHTLAIELIAKQVNAGFMSPNKMVGDLKIKLFSQCSKEKVELYKDNRYYKESAYNLVKAILDISGLNEKERKILANLSLVSQKGISILLFGEFCELDTFDEVNKLIELGWLEVEGPNMILKAHALVAELGLEIASNNYEMCEVFINNFMHWIRCDKEEGVDKKLENEMAFNLIRVGFESENTILILTKVAWDIFQFGYREKAIVYLEKARNICEKIYTDVNIIVAEVYRYLGSLYREEMLLDTAEIYLDKCLMILLELREEKSKEIAKAYNSLGQLYRMKGNRELSKKYFEEGIEICAENEDKEYVYGILYGNLGGVYRDMDDYENSVNCYIKAIDIFSDIEENKKNKSDLIATVYNNLGNLLWHVKKYQESIYYYEQAAIILENDYADDYENLAIIYGSLGYALNYMNETDSAINYYRKALNIFIRLHGKNDDRVASIYNKLGIIYREKKQFKMAEKMCFKGLAIRQKLFGDYNESVANSYSSIGLNYQKAGRIQDAIFYFEKAYMIRKSIFGEGDGKTEISLKRLQEIAVNDNMED